MEPIPTHNEENKIDTYIIKVQLNDGTVIFPAYISGNDIEFESKINNATNFFTSKYRGKGIIEIVIDENILKNQNINNWDTIKKEILENESNDKIGKLLKDLNNLGVGTWFIELMKKDLQVKDNIKLLKTYLDLSNFSEEDKQKTLLAMQIAIEAHKGQVQKRKKDKEGLDNIPYSNHPIQVALIALRDLKMSAEEIQASLLHDVVEDTDIELNGTTLKTGSIEGTFSENTINMVLNCSRKKGESRKEFMNKMKSLKGSSKVIKCLDRFHNMIRAFSIKDTEYINRYLTETKEVYLPAFEKMEELKPIKNLFYDVLEELEKYLNKLKNIN